MKRAIYYMTALAVATLAACGGGGGNSDPNPDPDSPQTVPSVSEATFAKGADISWVTEMEDKGQYFYNAEGTKTDCFALMKELGLNAVRLRVWVDPARKANGYCGTDDVAKKAARAKAAGLDVMIDFHYSDWWADPGQQHKPESWKGLNLADLKTAIKTHTTDVLNAVKNAGVPVKWVQVGNEIRPGMLWDEDASLSGAAYDIRYCDVKDSGNSSTAVQYPKNLANLGAFVATGYDAVKSVFPDAIVIVHIDKGHEDNAWFYDAVKQNGGKWDMIGLSLYPYWVKDEIPDANTVITRCISQIKALSSKYNCDVMVVEVGMQCADGNGNLASASVLNEGKNQLTKILTECKDNTNSRCKGVFYWEPECRPSQYQLGAFTEDGRPTVIMDAFQ